MALNFGRYSFEVSHPDKVLFPDQGITKGELIDYYRQVSDTMLPHIKDRPLAMHRFPDGIGGKDFFQKKVPDHFPGWIRTATVERQEQDPIPMVLANNAATLAYLANQACIAPHIWLSRADKLHYPDKMIFDLDPPEGRFDLVIEAARALRSVLDEELRLPAFVMTTGSRGLHIAVPLRRSFDFDTVRDYAHRICEQIAGAHPDKFTTEIRKEKRRGRLLLDYLRNAYGQHGIAPYALRALPGVPVATPLEWEELGELNDEARTYHIGNIFSRLEQSGDPWKGRQRILIPYR